MHLQISVTAFINIWIVNLLRNPVTPKYKVDPEPEITVMLQLLCQF